MKRRRHRRRRENGEKNEWRKKKIFHNNYDQSHFPMLKVNSLKEREKQNSNVIDYGWIIFFTLFAFFFLFFSFFSFFSLFNFVLSLVIYSFVRLLLLFLNLAVIIIVIVVYMCVFMCLCFTLKSCVLTYSFSVSTPTQFEIVDNFT